jgi:thymidine kinase
VSLEVIVGCMYAGKSAELVRRLQRAQIAGQKVKAFKPALDNRYHETAIATHLGGTFEATPVSSAEELRREIFIAEKSPQVIGFDEAQFMEPELIGLLNTLADMGVRVIVAGLDLDYEGNPFGPIPKLLALADEVTKLHAVCVARDPQGVICGRHASRSFRVPSADSGDQIQVGSEGVYEARCRVHWKEGRMLS